MSKMVPHDFQLRAVKAIAKGFVGDRIHSLAPKTSARCEAASKKGHACKSLRSRFRRGEFIYRQIAHEGNFAIYEQKCAGCPDPSICYEIIRVRRRHGFQIHGRFVEPAQIYPNSEAWGVDGWTALNKEAAFRKLREIATSSNALASFEQKEARRIEKSPT